MHIISMNKTTDVTGSPRPISFYLETCRTDLEACKRSEMISHAS